ncbi:MAG: hypothetical protein AAGA53_12630 [Pseudomonadota bacterium]
MIIGVCTDDVAIENQVNKSAASDPAVFGKAYLVFNRNIPDLKVDEDLFLVAHGAAFGDEDQPVIGSKSNAFYLTASDLNSNLHVFPLNYKGRIFVDACYSADPGKAGWSFVEKFKEIIVQSFPGVKVFGRTGSVGGPVLKPGDPNWKEA